MIPRLFTHPAYPVHFIAEEAGRLYLVPATANGWERRAPLAEGLTPEDIGASLATVHRIVRATIGIPTVD